MDIDLNTNIINIDSYGDATFSLNISVECGGDSDRHYRVKQSSVSLSLSLLLSLSLFSVLII